MREYKFRAWNDFFKEMYYFDFTQNIEVRVGGLWVIHKEGSVCVNSPKVIVMQYTGLRDCKRTEEYPEGQKVYEGDIIKTKNHTPEYYLIEFIEGGFCATHPQLDGYPIDINNFYPSLGCMFEVVGNNFDNSKLLK